MPSFLNDFTTTQATLLFVAALFIACGFEFVNGFHDTANAVATVIYTHSLSPWKAVVWSGICNFFGVFLGGTAVALSITHLLPMEALMGQGDGVAMILSLLVAAILWNLGTWRLGLPCSSSHTLFGAIVGAGLAHSLMPGHLFGQGINWIKAEEVTLSLLISPLLGFSLSYFLLKVFKKLIPNPELYSMPRGHFGPPWWIRGLLIFTCSGVSLAHGSNDGQKGVGLFMLILIAFLPFHFALNLHQTPPRFVKGRQSLQEIQEIIQNKGATLTDDPVFKIKLNSLAAEMKRLISSLPEKGNLAVVPKEQRWALRRDLLLIDEELAELQNKQAFHFSSTEQTKLNEARHQMEQWTDQVPRWIMGVVALSLGLGTMVGWKRVVVTVGEKIGNQHLTYAQGASAEIVAMGTIGLSSFIGMPVSTTHVLSSGVAGTMVAQKAGLQIGTVNKIAMAWLLTLPASALLSGLLFPLFLWLLR